MGSGIITFTPGNFEEVLSSEIIKHVGKFRFRGWAHDVYQQRSIDVNDVVELIMARDDLKYHSIDMAAQRRVDIRLIVTQLERLVEVDLSYSFFLVKKSWTFFFNQIISNDQVKLKCLKFEDITQDLIRDNSTSVDSNLIAEALCHIPEVHIKSHGFSDLFYWRNVFTLIEKIANSPQEDIELKNLVMVVQEDMNETILANAVMKIETLCLVGSKISPLQENTIYRHILQSDNLGKPSKKK